MAQTDESKAAKKVLAAVSGLDLDMQYLAGCLQQQGPEANKKMFELFIRTAAIWAELYDQGLVPEGHPLFNMAVYYKRISEVVSPHIALD